MMNTKRWATTTVSMLALCALLALPACSKKENTEQPNNATTEQPAAPATPIDPATVATIDGTVKFDGTAPKPAKIDMSQDANCAGTNTAENVIVADGKLANVFIYVKDGLGNRTFPVPAEAITLTQVGCKYKPHVLGVMTGQTIKIVNGDPTTHNIHPTPKDNREWNESQAPQAAALEKTGAGYPELFRDLFKYLSKLEDRGAKPNREAQMVGRFAKAHSAAQGALQKPDVPVKDGRISCVFPPGGIQDNTVNRLLLMLSSERHLSRVPMAFFIERADHVVGFQ